MSIEVIILLFIKIIYYNNIKSITCFFIIMRYIMASPLGSEPTASKMFQVDSSAKTESSKGDLDKIKQDIKTKICDLGGRRNVSDDVLKDWSELSKNLLALHDQHKIPEFEILRGKIDVLIRTGEMSIVGVIEKLAQELLTPASVKEADIKGKEADVKTKEGDVKESLGADKKNTITDITKHDSYRADVVDFAKAKTLLVDLPRPAGLRRGQGSIDGRYVMYPSAQKGFYNICIKPGRHANLTPSYKEFLVTRETGNWFFYSKNEDGSPGAFN